MEILKDYAMRFVGTPYKYGGDDPMEGVDCSWLVWELLRSVGLAPKARPNAQGLFDYFAQDARWKEFGAGALVFYGKSVKEISHVAMMLDNYRIIEAGGGDHTVVNTDVASQKNAFVRIRPLDYRGDRVAILKPRYPGML